MMGSEYDIGVLRKAAKAFEDLSGAFHQVNGRPGEDPYHIPEISWGYFEHAQECRQAYVDVRYRIHALMEGGGDTLAYVANSLRRAADGLERTEEAAADLLRKVGANSGTVADPSSAEIAAVLKEGVSRLGEGIVAVGDGIARSGDYLAGLITGEVEGTDPVPDPEAGRQTYYEAMEWAGPLIEFGESIRSHLDRAAQRFLDTLETFHEWSDRYVEIGHAANEWARKAKQITSLSLATGQVGGSVLRHWSGPAAEEFDTYLTYDLLPLFPVVARAFEGISAALAAIYDAFTDLLRSLTEAIRNGVGTAMAGIAGAAFTGGISAAAAGAALIAGLAVFGLEAWKSADAVVSEAALALGQLRDVDLAVRQWPEPQTSLADGTTTDGDASDWLPKAGGR